MTSEIYTRCRVIIVTLEQVIYRHRGVTEGLAHVNATYGHNTTGCRTNMILVTRACVLSVLKLNVI